MYLEDLDGPSVADLDAIEAEWPAIAAGLDALDAEIALIVAADSGGPTELDWRRHRRGQARVTAAAVGVAGRAARVCDLDRVA